MTSVPARIGIIPERFWLLAWLSGIIVSSLAPFDISLSRPWLLTRLRQTTVIDLSHGIALFNSAQILHVIAFFVLGLLLAAAHGHWLRQKRFVSLVVDACMVCMVLETVKLFEPTRDPSIADMTINIVALVSGIASSMRARPRRDWIYALQKQVSRKGPYFENGLVVVGLLLWWCAGLQPLFGSLRMDWNKDFRLMIGNESNRTRPWSGELRYAGIYDRPLSTEQIVGLEGDRKDGNAVASKRFDLLVGYNFCNAHPDKPVSEGALHDQRLDLIIPAHAESLPNGGLVLREPTLFITTGAATSLTEAIVGSGAFSVEAWFQPANLVQSGPSRIISLSEGVRDRNFTIGQSARDFVFRVRNRVNGANGGKYELNERDALDEMLQHFVAVYDHGVSTVYKNGRRLGGVVDLREPAYYSHLGTGVTGTVVCAALLGLIVALPIFSFISVAHSAAIAHFFAVTLTVCLGSLPCIISCLAVGGPWRPNFFEWFAGAILIAYSLGWLYIAVKAPVSEGRRDSRAQ